MEREIRLSWNDLTLEDKEKIWSYLENKDSFKEPWFIFATVYKLNKTHKKNGFGKNLLNHKGKLPHYIEGMSIIHGGIRALAWCCSEASKNDFRHIFLNEKEKVVLKLLSFFADNLTGEVFEKFCSDLNDILKQFNLNIFLTKKGFVAR
ncbi:MAG: hypothetical protein AAB494_00550 [Patescibacteria group bacterium]